MWDHSSQTEKWRSAKPKLAGCVRWMRNARREVSAFKIQPGESLQITHLAWVSQTCRKWFPNATMFVIAKGGQIANCGPKRTHCPGGEFTKVGLTRSRSFGPRGPLASPRFLSPLPKRLKSKVTIISIIPAISAISQRIYAIHTICSVIFRGRSAFAQAPAFIGFRRGRSARRGMRTRTRANPMLTANSYLTRKTAVANAFWGAEGDFASRLAEWTELRGAYDKNFMASCGVTNKLSPCRFLVSRSDKI